MAKPIFCGNFEYDSRESDLERLFRRYGRVERVDMKTGFAFIYMEDERDADDAIRGLDRTEFGRTGRKLRVEWTKDREVRSHLAQRRLPSANAKPSKTLFVINFDTHQTRPMDLERHFESYGKIMNVRIRKNFAFVQYETQEDATKALEAANDSKLLGRVLSVEYAVRDDDDDKRKGYSHDRNRDISPGRRGDERRRSPSPYRRDRGSPDYGGGLSSMVYLRARARPDYGRRRSRSPSRWGRPSPDYGRGSSHSPRQRDLARNDHAHTSGRSSYLNQNDRGRPENGRSISPAPYRRERASPDNERRSSHSPLEREGSSPVRGRGRSHSPHGRQKDSPENGGDCSPVSNPEARPGNNFAEDDSPMHQSRSPPAEE